ncbi:transcriptional regulator [Rhizobium leguminosarum]|uniref:Transcriptional regulator n=1 Tax=Rhizobium leguminosarum TaxID=384 RepID=A0A444I2U9_RHILE|nr:transcriptional regulator [Rhizobium leguminosarum]RWX31790.1 transcriptional regulator [Rhizobium leguminosarum]
MAEDTASNPPSDTTQVGTPVVPVEKKKRAPRQKKDVPNSSAASSAVAEVKSGRGRKARAVAPAEVPQIEKKNRGGRRPKAETVATAKPGQPVASPQVQPASASIGYEISDLLELETENQRLRKALAEKLRQENEDLRKRLGGK